MAKIAKRPQLNPLGVTFESAEQRLALRTMAEESQIMFTRYFFRLREMQRMTVNWHHIAVARAYDLVYQGMIPRLIINLPPGFTKTMFTTDFISRTMGVDPLSRSIQTTYNSKLANNNSKLIMETMGLPDYQAMWGTELSKDSSSKGLWNTRHGGGLLSSGITGTITGFRAGRVTPGYYSGGLFIDDPIKPIDANSKLVRDNVNGAMNDTLRSRLMLPNETPIVLTMQRVHDDDLSGFLLRGGTGEHWHHLMIPGKMKKEHLKPGKRYARKYPYGIPITYDDLFQTGMTWPLKMDKKEYKKIQVAAPFVARAQVDQDPDLLDGNFIKGKYVHFYRELPDVKNFVRVVAIADTAFEKESHNDRTVWMVFGLARDNKAYLLDYWGQRLEVPEVEQKLLAVWERFRNTETTKLPRITEFHVEKKASGHGIIQTMKRRGVSVKAVERNRDKVFRAAESLPGFVTGTIMLPAKGIKTPFTNNQQYDLMIDELMRFSADMTHTHDDYCDVLFDACELFYNKPGMFRSTFN